MGNPGYRSIEMTNGTYALFILEEGGLLPSSLSGCKLHGKNRRMLRKDRLKGAFKPRDARLSRRSIGLTSRTS